MIDDRLEAFIWLLCGLILVLVFVIYAGIDAINSRLSNPSCRKHDEVDTIPSSPKVLESKPKLIKKYADSIATYCSICLRDYKYDGVLRVLPNCEHFFHLKCIDPWLRIHPKCPLCRTSNTLG